MQSLLQSVSDLTKKVMPGDAEASVSLLVDDKADTAVFTGQLAMDCDESQYGHGYGPCLHAANTGETTEVADTRTETRWEADAFDDESRTIATRFAPYAAVAASNMHAYQDAPAAASPSREVEAVRSRCSNSRAADRSPLPRRGRRASSDDGTRGTLSRTAGAAATRRFR